MSFSRTIKMAAVLLVTLLVVVASAPQAKAALTLQELKNKASQECYSLVELALNKYKSDFNNADKYKNLANSITVNGSTLPAIRDAFKNGAASSYTDMHGLCTSIAGAPDLATAQTSYDALINRSKIVLPALKKAADLDSFYGRFKVSGDNYVYINSLATASGFSGYIAVGGSLAREGQIISQALATLVANFPRIVQDMPDLAWYNALFNPALDVNTFNGLMSSLNYKVSLKNNFLSSNSTVYNNGVRAMTKVFDVAARERVLQPGFPAYDKVFALYDNKSKSLRKDLTNQIDNYKISLNGLRNRIDPWNTKSLNLLDQTVETALLTKIVTATSSLNSIRGLLNPVPATDLSYNYVVARGADINALNINSILSPNVYQAINFNRSYNSASSSKQVVTRFYASYSDLLSGLPVQADKDALNNLKGRFDSDIQVASTELVSTDKTALETKIKNVAGSADLKDLSTSLNNYNKKLSAMNGKLSQYRSEWWKLIEKVARAGTIPNFNTRDWVKAESKAQSVFNDFARRRQSYIDQGTSIITSRQSTLERNLQVVQTLPYVPDAVQTAIDFEGRTANLEADLNSRLSAITSAVDYDDLASKVKAIKDLRISEAFIPLESVLVSYNGYYNRLDILNTVMTDPLYGAQARINAITDAATKASLQASKDQIVNSFFASYPNSLKDTLDNYLIDTSDPAITSLVEALNLNATAPIVDPRTDAGMLAVKAVKNNLSTVSTQFSLANKQIKELVSAIKKAEYTQAHPVTP